MFQEGDKLRDEDLYKFLADLKRPSNQLKKKCLPGLLKLDISPVRDQPKYCLTSELVKLHPYPGDLPSFLLTWVTFYLQVIFYTVFTCRWPIFLSHSAHFTWIVSYKWLTFLNGLTCYRGPLLVHTLVNAFPAFCTPSFVSFANCTWSLVFC